ncbi:hypothetical protein OAB57_03495, partial [Bacteriovoracaceae bacterium]|nr:hypothetical protein [Bacteriovoracaceae bacterium]
SANILEMTAGVKEPCKFFNSLTDISFVNTKWFNLDVTTRLSMSKLLLSLIIFTLSIGFSTSWALTLTDEQIIHILENNDLKEKLNTKNIFETIKNAEIEVIEALAVGMPVERARQLVAQLNRRTPEVIESFDVERFDP